MPSTTRSSAELVSSFFTLLGYTVEHIYQFSSWIPAFIVFMAVLIELAVSGP
ncbi:hypothetical protein PF008_g31220 [Phytophthora fragariae]|uniref:Uncharacterized protein n=1 Tax=Phytophthora fragariae TaxID=53985 RepID=A0A6A3DHQ1_9STRA|nr:hypothetical protein PF009_g31592 [Phytophthora fragariae]KAE9268007.1 hypothetical protein PF008_g31220 [Phytophthora fragariae]